MYKWLAEPVIFRELEILDCAIHAQFFKKEILLKKTKGVRPSFDFEQNMFGKSLDYSESFADPWRFGTDPDLRIHASD